MLPITFIKEEIMKKKINLKNKNNYYKYKKQKKKKIKKKY